MDVETFCKTYQRKMWQSMISRKNLNLNIWELIQHKQEQIYYMPYKGIHKFQVKTRHCLKCFKELTIGFRKNEFIVSTCKCSSDNKNYATMEKLTTLFSADESKIILKIFADYKTRKLSNRLKSWLDLGYTESEAEQKVTEIQTKRSNKSPAAQKGIRGYSPRTTEYWLKKGYTIEEAEKRVSEVQITNGLKWYISRYGKSEGEKKYNERITKWLESYKKAVENDPTINKRKMVSFCNASKESLEVFLPIYKKYKNQLKIYLGIEESHEYYLHNDNSIIFYDFTIPELKIIVEFNGSKFHPNSKILTESQLKNWRSLFSNETAETVVAKDTAKRKIAEHHGYTVITVWDTDNKEESIKIIEKLIESRTNGI